MRGRPMRSARSKPLEGARVLKFCEIAAGLFTGSPLADLGADVVKVERPVRIEGMDYRSGHPSPETGKEYLSARASLLLVEINAA